MNDSVTKASMLSVLGGWILTAVGVVMSVMTARVLGPEVKGLFTVFITTQGLLLLPGFALQTSLLHLIASRRPNWYRFKRYANRLVLLQSVVTVGTYAALIQIPSVRSVTFSNLDSIYLLVVFGTVFITLWFYYRMIIFPGLQMYSKGALWSAATSLVSNGLFLSFLCVWWLKGTSPKLTLVVVANFISICGGAALWAVATYRMNIGNANEFDIRELTHALIGFATPVFFRNMAEWMNQRMDVYFVHTFAGPSQLGLYTVAVGIVQQIWQIPFAVAGPVFAKVSAERDNQATREMVCYAFRVTLLISMVLGLCVFIVSPFLLPAFYGVQFAGSVPMLLLLLPGAVIVGSTRIISSYLLGIGRPGELLRGELIGLCVTVALDILLIPRIGALGAALASSVAYTVYTIFICHRFVAISESCWSELFSYRRQDLVRLKNRLVDLKDKLLSIRQGC